MARMVEGVLVNVDVWYKKQDVFTDALISVKNAGDSHDLEAHLVGV